MRGKIVTKQEAINKLHEVLKPGNTVYTDLKHVSRSGMYRRLAVYVIRDNEPRWLTYWVASALGWRFDKKHETLGVSGCGMDMGFHTVYSLSAALFPDGFGCIGQGCPANDHSNGDRDYTPHSETVVRKRSVYTDTSISFERKKRVVRHWHRDGGYALRHRWL